MAEKVSLYVVSKEGASEKVGECTIIDNATLGEFIVNNVEKHYELLVVDMADNTVMRIVDQSLVFPVPNTSYFSTEKDAHVPDTQVENPPPNKWDPVTRKFVSQAP